MSIFEHEIIKLEPGLEFLQTGITKLKKILNGLPEPQFTSTDYMMMYTYPFGGFLLMSVLVLYCYLRPFR